MKSKAQFKRTPNIIFLLLAGLMYSHALSAQGTLPGRAIQVIAGYSKHGSGDLNGIVFGTEYIKYLSNRLALNYNFRASINDSRDEIIVTNNATGESTDGSVRFTTAGVQLGLNGQYSFFRNIKHELFVSLGAFGRYQSASNGSDGYGIYYPPLTGLPLALIAYNNRSPQETFTIGGILQLQYSYTLRNQVFIGTTPGFQTDTNGDVLPQIALTVGRRF